MRALASCFESIYFQMGDVWLHVLIARRSGLRLLSVARVLTSPRALRQGGCL